MLGGAVAASERLADRLTDEGYAGMLVRSFAFAAGEDDVNLALWRWGTATQLARFSLTMRACCAASEV